MEYLAQYSSFVALVHAHRICALANIKHAGTPRCELAIAFNYMTSEPPTINVITLDEAIDNVGYDVQLQAEVCNLAERVRASKGNHTLLQLRVPDGIASTISVALSSDLWTRLEEAEPMKFPHIATISALGHVMTDSDSDSDWETIGSDDE